MPEAYPLCPDTFGEDLPAERARSVFNLLQVGGSVSLTVTH